MIANWYSETITIFLIIPGLIILAFRGIGFYSITSAVGPSVASAKLPKLSIIKLTYNNYIDVSGELESTADPRNVINRATTLTVIWN